ncbi:Uncharacterised protein [Mycobacterium tuberculosis]|nr:Uncharacterised protein [Mycobacterium tuberculosis]
MKQQDVILFSVLWKNLFVKLLTMQDLKDLSLSIV